MPNNAYMKCIFSHASHCSVSCLDISDNLQKDDLQLSTAPASRLPHLGCDMQHYLVTRHSSWLATKGLQSEAMCLLACL